MIFKELPVRPSFRISWQSYFTAFITQQLFSDDSISYIRTDHYSVIFFPDGNVAFIESLIQKDIQKKSVSWIEPVLFVFIPWNNV